MVKLNPRIFFEEGSFDRNKKELLLFDATMSIWFVFCFGSRFYKKIRLVHTGSVQKKEEFFPEITTVKFKLLMKVDVAPNSHLYCSEHLMYS